MLDKHIYEAMELAQKAMSAGSRAIERLTYRVAELEAERDELREYAQHKKFCARLDVLGLRLECTCGLDAVLDGKKE